MTVICLQHNDNTMSDVIVWYDGACPLCVREIALMRRLDKRARIAFIDLMDSEMGCPLDRELLLSRFHAFENGVMLSGAAAFAAMWRVIPVLRPLGLMAHNPIILRILERIYLLFLRIRPRIQRAMGAKPR